MSREIPDRKVWVIEGIGWGIHWHCEYAGPDEVDCRRVLKQLKVEHPTFTFRILEQTISSKVVEG